MNGWLITVFMEEGPTRIWVGCEDPAMEAFARIRKDPRYPGTLMSRGPAPQRSEAEKARADRIMMDLFAN